ncbi:hypothetical protein [Pulveribacter sp.]|uniref:hypothetical protein n=1 Tax=Pulveribacter sp. TaxID=2678893 RepID=UPI000EBF69D3|nr:hypothetical protein [Pulveribacter sp.]HCL85818.1 hypothetical protein [Comamonadaceae bacterium]
MQRCFPSHSRAALLLCGAALLAGMPAAASAQQAPVAAGQRTFPANAERGTLKILSRTQGELNGKAVRLAPGLRIFNQQNALVFAHTLAGEPLTVNYVMEASTGRLLTAWLLTPAEAKSKARKGSAPAPQPATAL